MTTSIRPTALRRASLPGRRVVRRMVGLALVPMTLGSLNACRNEGTSPNGDAARITGGSRELAPGVEVTQPGSAVFAVSLLGVTQDSRCPARVTCVWAGDAHVQLAYRMGSGPTVPFTLHLNTAPRDTVIGNTRVTLDSLTPYPQEPTPPIPASRYRAWVTMATAR